MIPARKSRAFNLALHPIMRAVLRRRFHSVRVAGAERLRELRGPVIGCANHTNWWDGFVLYALSERLLQQQKIFLAMEERNLRLYRFFPWMGAFALDLADPLPGLRYALRLLQAVDEPLVWMFVQGKLARANLSIDVRPGALWLARRSRSQILPVILRYEWLSESRPTIFVRFGEPLRPEIDAPALSSVLNRLAAELDAALDSGALDPYKPLFKPRMSMNRRWDYLVHRLRGRREPFQRDNG